MLSLLKQRGVALLDRSRKSGWVDLLVVVGLAGCLFGLVDLAREWRGVMRPTIAISLSPWALPQYTFFSLTRGLLAYTLSLAFTLVYGYWAAKDRVAEHVLIPLLDILQSIPVLGFMPGLVLALVGMFPSSNVGLELAAVLMIFTGQAWNMTFSFYQSMTTIPLELREAAAIFRLDPWARFKTLELPFGAIGLLWNSMMSWSGGWFFLMAAEIFHVGSRDFRLPGLGSYLQAAANAGDLHAVLAGLTALVIVIVTLDQFVWRPLTRWTDKFKVEMLEAEQSPHSWFAELLSRAWLIDQVGRKIWNPFSEWADGKLRRPLSGYISPPEIITAEKKYSWLLIGIGFALAAVAFYGAYRAAELLIGLPATQWAQLGVGLFATFVRVAVSLLIALLWTVPLGVAIGTNRRLANVLQPVVQVIAAIPATALFPILLLALLNIPGGLNIAAVALMLMGTQWYLLFNVIAGASAIPQDLLLTTDLLQLSRIDRWRTLILPALFPYIVTGAITASGGAWNASVIAEQVEFGGQTRTTTGIGAVIAKATGAGNFSLLLGGTLALVLAVVLVNRLFWQRLYRVAEERYRLE